jgi:hypothetical protein
VFGFKSYSYGVAKALQGLDNYVTSGKVPSAWREAFQQGVLHERGVTRFTEEAGTRIFSEFGKKLAGPAEFTENFNRVVSYWTGKHYFLSHGKLNPLAIRTISPELARRVTPEQVRRVFLSGGKGIKEKGLRAKVHEAAVASGRGAVNATQFILTSEGKPLLFAGGAGNRLIGQFKTFPVAYSLLLKDAYLLGKSGGRLGLSKKEAWAPYIRMVSSLGVFGGLPTLAAGATFGSSSIAYDSVRKEMYKLGLPLLPAESGLGFVTNSALELSGLGARSPLDITSGIEPFNWPRHSRYLFPWLLGPALGAGYTAYTNIKDPRRTWPEAAKEMIKLVSPGAGAIAEASGEAARGGVFTPVANRRVAKRSWPHIAARGAGLQPPVLSQRRKYLDDLSLAMEAKRPKDMRRIIKEARSYGIIIGDKDIATLKGSLTTKRKRQPQSAAEWFKEVLR